VPPDYGWGLVRKPLGVDAGAAGVVGLAVAEGVAGAGLTGVVAAEAGTGAGVVEGVAGGGAGATGGGATERAGVFAIVSGANTLSISANRSAMKKRRRVHVRAPQTKKRPDRSSRRQIKICQHIFATSLALRQTMRRFYTQSGNSAMKAQSYQ